MWIWALRISYPREEIYVSDDDVQGCFRLVVLHPDMVSTHAFLFGVWLLFFCSQSFGCNFCPANWEALADARQAIAVDLWKKPKSTLRAKPYLPQLTFIPPPMDKEIAQFTPANADSINTGALTPAGIRRPPPFPTHVDHTFNTDILNTMILTIASSILALYIVVGFPQTDVEPDPMSWEKFESTIT